VRSDVREQGLATKLMQLLLDALAGRGVRNAVLVYPAQQARLASLAHELGFTAANDAADPARIRAVKTLHG
jgi:predicted N-acetyltransferase YhbS